LIWFLVAILTATQIYNLAQEAGFRGQDAINATAVALAESSGNTSVVNSIGAMGLWQIYDGHYPDASRIAAMSDPLANARAAYAKFQASQQTTCGGWWPWASYNEGPCHNSDPNRNNTWRSFLNVAQTASEGGVTTGDDTGATGGATGTIASGAALVTAQSQASENITSPSFLGNTALGKIFTRLASPGFWWSVGFMLLAALLIIVGLLVYFHKEVESAVGRVGAAAAAA